MRYPFLGLLTGLFVAVGGLLGGRGGMVMAFGLALVMNYMTHPKCRCRSRNAAA